MSRFNALAGAALILGVVLAFATMGQAALKQVLPSNSVGTDQIRAGAVTRGKIRNVNVTRDKLALSAVGEPQLANGAVSSAKLRNGSVTQARLASGAVGATQLAARAVGPTQLAPLPGAGVRSAVAIEVQPNTRTTLAFNGVWFNNGAVFALTDPTRLRAPIAGIYLVNANIAWGTAGSGVVRIDVMRNGSQLVASDIRETTAGRSAIQSVSQVGPLAAGDTLELVAVQTSPGPVSITTQGQASPNFQLVYLGPSS